MTLARIGLGVGVLLLAAMAGLQLNDPDPTYWFATYLVASFATIRALLDKPAAWLGPLAAGLVLAGLLISGPGFVDYVSSGDYAALTGAMSEHKPYVESAREFIGLLIAAVVLWSAQVFSRKQ